MKNSPFVILSGVGGVGKTALVKDIYDSIQKENPFFVFKANEFDVPHINQFFRNYGDFTLTDFVKEFEDEQPKYLVIDSSEKISDFQNTESLRELLGTLLDHKWKVIFTTRHSYLDDLRFQFIEIYDVDFKLFNIENLHIEELEYLAKTHNFNLPKNEKVLELLRNPFYLNNYLQNYERINGNTNHTEFKDLLWDRVITKSVGEREKCFLQIAEQRAKTSSFFVYTSQIIVDKTSLKSLEADEILKRDPQTGGYFITHDVYEEWALDKIIERNFLEAESSSDFFCSIDGSLPFRRAFREWLSNKLITKPDEAKELIENSIENSEIKKFWKDEILVSVLLSDYSEDFFQMFEKELLANNQDLLIKAIFLLRIACKEIDENALGILGLGRKSKFSLNFVFTKPKGNGWGSAIAFIYKHQTKIGLSQIDYILPLISDWNSTNKKGETTKKASQIALFFYEQINKEQYSYHFKDDKKQVIKIILNGSVEIKDELTAIFDDVISRKETDTRGNHFELVGQVLSSALDSFEISKNLPNKVIEIANLFWFRPYQDDWGIMGVDKYFGISQHYDHKYFPASSFQTPIFQLLRFAPQEAIDFILSFTNKTVELYAKSNLDEYQVEEIEILIDEKTRIKQVISGRIWNMYRGTSVVPHILSSLHMALEKFLLDFAKDASKEQIENWCKHLIKNSKSASITAIVVSLVLAYPEKLFKIALILFQTKELFLYETARVIGDQTAKNLYSIGYELNYDHQMYQDERIKTCDDNHRKFTLEDSARNYQFFSYNETINFDLQQENVWKILDRHYSELPPETEQSDEDKTWRIYLARMDRRKMSPKVDEEKDGKILISFNPQLEDDIQEISSKSSTEYAEKMRFVPLQLWARSRLKKEKETYEKYEQFEKKPQLAFEEMKRIADKLKNDKDEDAFNYFNRSTISYVAVVLLRDFNDTLNEEEKLLCGQILFDFATLPLVENYYYQITDGTEPAVSNINLIFHHFSDDKVELKILPLILLLQAPREVKVFVINSFHNGLWESNFADAQSIFLNYLSLKPKYDEMKLDLEEQKRESNPQKTFILEWGQPHPNSISKEELLEAFFTKYENELNDVSNKKVTHNNWEDLEQLDFSTLKKAFYLLPNDSQNDIAHGFVSKVTKIFADSKKMSEEDKHNGYTLKREIYKKIAYFILSSSEEKAKGYVQPFIDNFEVNENFADLISELVSAEDNLNQYENFWMIWELFYEKIAEACIEQKNSYGINAIVHNYLLAWQWWKKDAKSWRSLKDREKLFFQKVSKNIGGHPSVFYSLSKFLNEIGSGFIDDGIVWISDIIKTNDLLKQTQLETNTVYYLENLVRKYILMNRGKIRTTKKVKNQLIVILDFLVEKGSSTGYLLREEIL